MRCGKTKKSVWLNIHYITLPAIFIIPMVNQRWGYKFQLVESDSKFLFGIVLGLVSILRCVMGLLIDVFGHRHVPRVMLVINIACLVSVMCMLTYYRFSSWGKEHKRTYRLVYHKEHKVFEMEDYAKINKEIVSKLICKFYVHHVQITSEFLSNRLEMVKSRFMLISNGKEYFDEIKLIPVLTHDSTLIKIKTDKLEFQHSTNQHIDAFCSFNSSSKISKSFFLLIMFIVLIFTTTEGFSMFEAIRHKDRAEKRLLSYTDIVIYKALAHLVPYFCFTLTLVMTNDMSLHRKKVSTIINLCVIFFPLIGSLGNLIAPQKRKIVYGLSYVRVRNIKSYAKLLDARLICLSIYVCLLGSQINFLMLFRIERMIHENDYRVCLVWFFSTTLLVLIFCTMGKAILRKLSYEAISIFLTLVMILPLVETTLQIDTCYLCAMFLALICAIAFFVDYFLLQYSIHWLMESTNHHKIFSRRPNVFLHSAFIMQFNRSLFMDFSVGLQFIFYSQFLRNDFAPRTYEILNLIVFIFASISIIIANFIISRTCGKNQQRYIVRQDLS